MTASVAPAPERLRAWTEAEEQRLRERGRTLPFEPAEYRARLDRLRAAMAADGIDVLLLTAPDTMCWLHGLDARWYRSHSGSRFPPAQATLVHVDHHRVTHLETAAHEQLVRLTSCVEDFVPIPGSTAEHEPTLAEFTGFLVAEFARRGWSRATVGVERWSSVPNPATAAAVEAALTTTGCAVRDVSGLVRGARRTKSPAEISMVEAAQRAADAGIVALHQEFRVGMTGLQAWELFIRGVVAAGGEPTAMHETVAAGPPMPTLHGASTRRPIGRGDYFHADGAGAVHRYHARATRLLVAGPPPAELVRMTEIAAGAHEVLLDTARVGMPFRELHAALRRYFADAGADGWAGGYELGISFPPDWVGEFAWDANDDATTDVIEDGLVTNVEAVAFGTALVDTVVFEAAGPRLLSTLPREVLVVDPG